MKFPKAVIVRSESYRRFVAMHDCFACGVSDFSQAAHPNVGKGMAMKTCDLKAFPLCGPHWGLPGCHYMHDNLIDMTRDQRRELEDQYVERMQQLAREAGRPEFARAA